MRIRICHRDNDGKQVNCVNVGTAGGPVWSAQNRPDPPSRIAQVPGVYPELYTDASTVNTISHFTQTIADKGVRDSIQSGIDSAVKALQKRAGENVTIAVEEEAVGKSA
jgi:hypothetical protein